MQKDTLKFLPQTFFLLFSSGWQSKWEKSYSPGSVPDIKRKFFLLKEMLNKQFFCCLLYTVYIGVGIRVFTWTVVQVQSSQVICSWERNFFLTALSFGLPNWNRQNGWSIPDLFYWEGAAAGTRTSSIAGRAKGRNRRQQDTPGNTE